MAGLILKLRAHEQILVNGVVMQNGDRSARLIVQTPNVHILRLRDAIPAGGADTPVKRVCYIAQSAVAGEIEAEEAAAQLGSGIAQLRDAFGDAPGDAPGDAAAGRHLDAALEQLRERNFYGVLRALRRMLPVEARQREGPADGGAEEAAGEPD